MTKSAGRQAAQSSTIFLTEEGYESGYRDYQKLLTSLLDEVASLAPADLDGKEGEELLRISHPSHIRSGKQPIPGTGSAISRGTSS